MKNNKFWTAFLSVIIAFGLWFYVVTVVKPESTNTYYNIPVVLDGESFLTEQELMIVGGMDSTVTMELYGNRTDLDKVNSGNITLIADLSKIREPGEYELPYSHRFPGDVPSGALTIQSKSPSTIKLKVERRVSKPINVEPVYIGEMPDSGMYIVDTNKAELDNKTIKISGPESVIQLIDKATIDVDLTGQTGTFKVTDRITLRDKDGNPVDVSLVKPSVEEVTVTLPIRYFKYIYLLPEDVVDGGGATKETSSIQYSPATIMVSGSKEVLSKKTSIGVGIIELGKLTKPVEELTFEILLDEGLTCESGETEAKVTVSFPNLATKELIVNEIQVLNVPEGFEYELLTKELKVTVRGPKDVVHRVKPNDLTLTIDFTGAVAGTATFTPVITVDNTKQPGVGVIGEYSISATLQEGTATADVTTP